MRIELFVGSHYLHSVPYAAYSILCEMLECNLAVVAVEVMAANEQLDAHKNAMTVRIEEINK